MTVMGIHGEVLALTRPRGAESRRLTIGGWVVALEGLDAALARRLDERWGPFLQPAGGTLVATVAVADAGSRTWIDAGPAGERYRVESRGAGSRQAVVSYRFALAAADAEDRNFRLALTDDCDEPADRRAENALRLVVARVALRAGGFAMHGAAVLGRGLAWVFAGPSGSGKTTAVARAAPARSLGDDFAVVVPAKQGWTALAVPFDNAERTAGDAARGDYPLAGVWRLFQASTTRIERPPSHLAAASLLSTMAFPWTLPGRSAELSERAERFVAECRFGHLHFTPEADLWGELITGDARPSV